MPPHNPLSDARTTTSFFSAFMDGASPSSAVNGCHTPREFSAFTCMVRSLDAATIFMAMVIFLMLFTDLMRARTSWFDALRAPNGVSRSPTSPQPPGCCCSCGEAFHPHGAGALTCDAWSRTRRSARRDDDASADAPAAIAIDVSALLEMTTHPRAAAHKGHYHARVVRLIPA